MLKTLAGRDPSEAKRLLTSATDLLLPHPQDADSSSSRDPVVDNLLAEVRRQVKVSPNDDSGPARAAVLNFLAKQLADILLYAKPLEIRARLGERGQLPASLYRLQFEGIFREAQKRGIKRSHVENAVYFPDAIEHLLPEKLHKDGYPAASLYGKIFGEPSDPDRYTLLVITRREKDIQFFGSAWRVYHSDVDVSTAATLVDTLRAFVNVYGLEISVGGSITTEKLILYNSFQAAPGTKPTQVLQIHSPISPIPRFEMHHFLKLNAPSGIVEVAVAFAINMTKHGQDLERHGVKVES